GGLYRDVSLIETNKAYFGDHVFGAHGVYVSTPKVSSESADVSITAKLNNSLDETQRFRLKSTIYSFKNEVVKSTETAVILSPGEELSVSQQIMAIRNPTLWSPQRPYLYKIKTQLLTENGQTYDEIVNPLAFRWFSFDAE